jgi:hypothetical protein
VFAPLSTETVKSAVEPAIFSDPFAAIVKALVSNVPA